MQCLHITKFIEFNAMRKRSTRSEGDKRVKELGEKKRENGKKQ